VGSSLFLSVAAPVTFVPLPVQPEERQPSAHTCSWRTGWRIGGREELPTRITAAAAAEIAGSIVPLITQAANYHAKHREL